VLQIAYKLLKGPLEDGELIWRPALGSAGGMQEKFNQKLSEFFYEPLWCLLRRCL